MNLTDKSGNIANSYDYDAFGNTVHEREKVSNSFRYSGQQKDGNGLYYQRARYYNPVTARFTQEDEYLGDGLNLYAYVGNNPVKYEDPSGYAKSQCELKAELLERKRLREEGKKSTKFGNEQPKPGTRTLTREQYKKKDSEFRNYLRDIETKTGTKMSKEQRELLRNDYSRNDYSKPVDRAEYEKITNEYEKTGFKDKLRKEWEKQTGQKWPVHENDVISPKIGKPYIRKGDPYDLHHVVERNYGGKNTWWNSHLARRPDIHQGGIHAKDSPGSILFP